MHAAASCGTTGSAANTVSGTCPYNAGMVVACSVNNNVYLISNGTATRFSSQVGKIYERLVVCLLWYHVRSAINAICDSLPRPTLSNLKDRVPYLTVSLSLHAIPSPYIL